MAIERDSRFSWDPEDVKRVLIPAASDARAQCQSHPEIVDHMLHITQATLLKENYTVPLLEPIARLQAVKEDWKTDWKISHFRYGPQQKYVLDSSVLTAWLYLV